MPLKQRFGPASVILGVGFIVGVGLRLFVDDAAERELANYVRSGLHGSGIAFAAWFVQGSFAARAHSSVGAALRRMPLLAEVLVRSLVMTVVIVIVGLALQIALYAESLQLHWLTVHWFKTSLPWIVVVGLTMSVMVGVVIETARLIGGPLLASIVLGTYQRPVREQLIVMFLDLADSTSLAEKLGELRVHDLITRFFFDIDEPIHDHGVPNAHGTQSACDDRAVDPITVSDHVTESPVPRKGLGYLTCNPLCCRVGCDADPREVPAIEPHDNEGIEQIETNGRDNKQVHGGNVWSMITQEGLPSLIGRPPSFDHVLGDARRRDFKPELEQFAVDTWRAPKRIFDAHPPDQYPQPCLNPRSPSQRERLPTPVAAKAGPMPTHQRLGPDDCENLQD